MPKTRATAPRQSWQDIPIEDLRTLMAELVRDSNLRETARLIGRGREQVRKFVAGEIETPHPSTREAIAKLYEQRQKISAAEPHAIKADHPARIPLRMVLPDGIEKATAEIRAMFGIIHRHSGETPECAGALEKWLLTHVRDEYVLEVPFARPRRRKPRIKPEEKQEP